MTKQNLRIELIQAYETIPRDKGHYRVLVDRLWPRGVKREELDLDVWMRQLSPSSELRKWFGHDLARWDEFRKRYFKELDKVEHQVSEMLGNVGKRTILLIYGSKDEKHNQAVVLKEWIEEHATKLKTLVLDEQQ